MTIGDNGFLRPTQEGGLQINVPETYSASKGVGVQLLGRELGRIPKGMFIYNSPNWNGGNIIGDNTEDILLTVKGRVSLCNLHNGSPVSGVPIISNFEYQILFEIYILFDLLAGILEVTSFMSTMGLVKVEHGGLVLMGLHLTKI